MMLRSGGRKRIRVEKGEEGNDPAGRRRRLSKEREIGMRRRGVSLMMNKSVPKGRRRSKAEIREEENEEGEQSIREESSPIFSTPPTPLNRRKQKVTARDKTKANKERNSKLVNQHKQSKQPEQPTKFKKGAYNPEMCKQIIVDREREDKSSTPIIEGNKVLITMNYYKIA